MIKEDLWVGKGVLRSRMTWKPRSCGVGWLHFPDGQVLSLACGTGRFLNLATHGLDASEKMAAVARQKLPGKTIHVGRAEVVDRLGIRPDVNGRVLLRRSG